MSIFSAHLVRAGRSVFTTAMSWGSYSDFLIRNNVLTVAAGITFGQATLQLIKSFVADMLMPAVYLALLALKGAVAPHPNASRAQSGGGRARGMPRGRGRGRGRGTGTGTGTGTKAATVDGGGFLSSVLVHKELQFANFIAEVISYILVLLTAYLLINYLHHYMTSQEGRGSLPPPPSVEAQAPVDGGE